MSADARNGFRDETDMLVALRRDLHAHPELGFEEERTAALVREKLVEVGLTVEAGIGGTGLVATLTVGNGPRRIALRADMDALAMHETARDRPWKSTVANRMHACGHDGHTAMLLGAARRLARTRNFSGTVHFVFQPAEEGRGGARAMVDQGLFRKFPVDAVYGLHNMPGMPVGEMAVVEGAQLASSDRWRVTFQGEGTHGGKPHLGRDPIVAAGQFLAALQTVVSRRVNPTETAVVSACAIHAGDFAALNVIPDEIAIGGTARAYSAAVRDLIEAEIGRLAEGLAAAHGIEFAYGYTRQIPPVINHPDATARALGAARAAVGAGRVATAFPPSTAGDDFAVFAENAPGAYVWLGNGPAGDGALHHNSRYDFNDAALPVGVEFWTRLVERELSA